MSHTERASQNPTPMLEVRGVVKHFGKFTALHGVNFSVPRGELYGLLGHNGAGKSTIFGTTLGQVHPSAGEVFIDGVSVQRRRADALRKVGAIFETPAFWDYLPGWDNLRILANMSGVRAEAPLHEALEIVGLGEGAIRKKVGEYSHGMRQRLALAQALIPRPELLLLDEPTDGLDPVGIIETRDLLTRLNRELGITIVLSSHLLGEIEHLCSRIAIIRQGKLVYEGRWKEAPGQGTRVQLHASHTTRRVEDFVRELGAVPAAQPGEEPLLVTLPAQLQPADINERLVHAGFRVHQLNPLSLSLEELYRELNPEIAKNPAL
jgi:ABC-2 type transport system ATP-binding protein